MIDKFIDYKFHIYFHQLLYLLLKGHGETILKVCLAHSIIIGMEKGLSPQEATTQAIDAMTNRLTETAGAITLSNKGDIGMYFSSKMMAWCYVKSGKIHYGIKPNEHNIEDFDVNTS